ncbi:N utilization substance protein B [Marmoricola endophyticus]|uniref:Transcription antitermination protein NusB n=1 Tax=Marmoricola endophyticus TaxID=2040280 RepID=A0A917F1N2_9ACTN|nr:transcription antitermination factor NusB [Marmoricola endophyticus]GGF35927.1 N utilization substance protein B [Marmoricola endophyticus]
MGARTKARKRALDLLFASEVRGRSAVEALEEEVTQAVAPKAGVDARPVADYTGVLVRGVTEHRERIDELLSTYSREWSLARMPSVDRNVLRLGVFEVLWVDDVPDAVAVSEALGLVRDLSTDESPAFVNGVLGTIVRDKAELAAL